MREGIRGHEDVNRTRSSSGFLLEQILCYQRGFFSTAEDQRWEYSSKDTMSHHNGRWGHWGHQRLHGYSQTHVLLKREWLQAKPCLTLIVARTETRQKHSGHWVLPIHEMRLNRLKMQRGLAAQKDYWNCYCELR
jgi:hypothetical protein